MTEIFFIGKFIWGTPNTRDTPNQTKKHKKTTIHNSFQSKWSLTHENFIITNGVSFLLYEFHFQYDDLRVLDIMPSDVIIWFNLEYFSFCRIEWSQLILIIMWVNVRQNNFQLIECTRCAWIERKIVNVVHNTRKKKKNWFSNGTKFHDNFEFNKSHFREYHNNWIAIFIGILAKCT